MNISPSARDLLQRLLCSRERRLGCGGLADFQRHPFFVKIEWNSLRKSKTQRRRRRSRIDLLAQAPFIPSRNPSMIEDPPLVDPIPAPIDRSRSRAPILRHTAFIGFTSSNSQNDEPEKVRRSSDDDPMQKYLLTVVQFFDSLRGTKSSLPRTSSFETLKTHLDKQMQTCRSLDSPSSTFTRRSLADQVDQLIQQFSSENPPSPVDKLTEPVLLRLQAFLERTSQQLKTTSREKLDLEEKRDRKVSSISNKEVNPVSSPCFSVFRIPRFV